jgi:DNA polymerase III delta prime subunit
MDLLRLAGAPGVGKTTTAWAVAQRIAGNGEACAYVDIDQLGMCYPAPADDADRWALKERALDNVADEFSRAGVDRLVVSGVAWPDDPPPQIAGVSVSSIWLDASELTRRNRLGARKLKTEQLARTLSVGTAEADRLHSAWERIQTDHLSAAETVECVLARWPATDTPEMFNRERASGTSGDSSRSRVLWITGPRLSGASRIGWEVVNREWSAGRRAGFMDLAQLSFAWNCDVPVGLANLGRLHDTFRDVGAELLVVVAPLEIDPIAVSAALPESDISFARLAPSDTDLRAHARSRKRGDGGWLAGDDLLGATDAAIDSIVRTAHEQSLLRLRSGELSVDTRGLSPAEAATCVRHAAGW